MKGDIAQARSLVEQAELELSGLAELPINEKTAGHVLRGAYEPIRMLGKALLVARGIVTTDDHKESIAALLSLAVKTESSLAVLDELRKKRHRVHYYGQRVSVPEVSHYVKLVEQLYPALLKAVKEELEKQTRSQSKP